MVEGIVPENKLLISHNVRKECKFPMVLDLFELTDRAWAEVDRSTGPWDLQAETIIETSRGCLTGPGAMEWDFSGTIHVVTGSNPQGIPRTDAMNAEANAKLAKMMDRREVVHSPAVGRSPDGTWAESGFLVEGASRDQALELGRLFSQLSVFEATGDWLRVLRCSDGAEMCCVPRTP